MAVDLKGLSDNARKTSISGLNERLADALALALAVKQAHWNVKGRNFIAVHELFDRMQNSLREHIDVMAERIQQLDGVAIGTAEKVAATSSIAEYPTDLTRAEDHIRALSGRYRDLGERLRAAIDAADAAGDSDTADIFTAASRAVDKDLWFLESHLE